MFAGLMWRGKPLAPKTENAYRMVDVDAALLALLREHLRGRTEGWVFRSERGTPLAPENIRNRLLGPLLDRLGIEKAGLHAFRHSRVTMLRKYGTPEHWLKQWIGHSGLDKRMTDTYCHSDQDLEYRRAATVGVGLDRLFGLKGLPIGPTGPERRERGHCF